MDLTPPPTAADASRDVSRIAREDAVEQPWPGNPAQRGDGFQVLIKRSVLNEIHRHGRSVDRIEVCGALVGTLRRDEHGPYLYIQDSICGQHAQSANISVTFTAETWSAIQAEMDQAQPDQKILGWYHTHPGFGVFLSGMDLFIQENFFGLPWQIALVYDPIAHEDGLFIWRQDKTAAQTLLVEEDEPEEKFESQQTRTNSASLPPSALAGYVTDLEGQIQKLHRQVRWLMLMILLLAIFAIIWTPLLLLAMSNPSVRPQFPSPTTHPKESAARLIQ